MWAPLNRSGRDERVLELLLRVGVAGCFIGHGAFGLIGKEAWLPYFAVVGIGEDLARVLMPVIGGLDVVVGIVALLSPRPLVLAYAAFWALWTALLRPLAGESLFETLERAGNYGIPIALLVMAATRLEASRAWIRPLVIDRLTAERRVRLELVFRATIVTLLVGHGGLALSGKPMLAEHLAAVGLQPSSLTAVGLVEIALALAVAIRPLPGILAVVLAWKIGTEALFPIAGAPFWEFVERAGSYVAPLALWTMLRGSSPRPVLASTAARRTARGAWIAACLTVFAGLAPAAPASDRPAPDRTTDTTLLADLRAGGHVLACRHASTDRSRGDARSVSFDDPSTQRVLSEDGRAQARRLGDAIDRLQIPIGRVLTSPYARTKDSADLAFGRSERSDALLYGNSAEQRRERTRLLSEPPPEGNRVLMTHQGVLYGSMPDVERGSIREGDCLVVRPMGEGAFEVVRRVGADEWDRLDSAQSSASAVIRAVRQGGLTVLCRHAITDDTREVEPVDYADPGTQRLLSEEGERQSVAMGAAMRSLGIVVSELIASPMDRARRTAELMFDHPVKIDTVWHTNGGSYRGGPLRQRRRVLSTPVERGNRLIVSHIGTIASAVPAARGELGEGDCAALRAEDGGFDLVGFVPSGAWEQEADRVERGV